MLGRAFCVVCDFGAAGTFDNTELDDLGNAEWPGRNGRADCLGPPRLGIASSVRLLLSLDKIGGARKQAEYPGDGTPFGKERLRSSTDARTYGVAFIINFRAFGDAFATFTPGRFVNRPVPFRLAENSAPISTPATALRTNVSACDAQVTGTQKRETSSKVLHDTSSCSNVAPTAKSWIRVTSLRRERTSL
jgi:hypothetical protein